MNTKILQLSSALGLGLAALVGALALLGGWGSRSPITQAQGLDTHNTYHVAPSCTGVPTPCYTTVQAAVDATDDPGDVIKVATGIYTGVTMREGVSQIVYISKTVTVRGGYTVDDWDTSDPAANPTTLDAQGEGRVLCVTGDIQPTIEGLRITGGDATGLGGGRWRYDGTGGGVYVVSATATIRHCTIYSNVASRDDWGGGGGVYLWDTPAVLINNVVYSNTAGMSPITGFLSGEGGGVAMSESEATLSGNLIYHNVASSAGDGIGGGLYIEGWLLSAYRGTATLYGNVVRDNVASRPARGYGGGIYVGPDNAFTLVNTVVVNNVNGATPDSRGAGIAVEHSAPRLLHTTLHDNTGGDGSGVHISGEGIAGLTNTILTSQTVGVVAAEGSTATVDSVLWHANGANTGGAGTITVTYATDGNPAFAADGYHLIEGSPAIDGGMDVGVPIDIDGQDRPYGGLPDLGADEWYPCTSLTDVSIAGPSSGYTETRYTFTGTIQPPDASDPIAYVWWPQPDSGQRTASASYEWDAVGVYSVTLTAENRCSVVRDTHTITIEKASPECPHPLDSVTISGPIKGYTDTLYAFTAAIQPPNASEPIAYDWSPPPESGQGTASASYEWATPGVYTVTVAAENCGGEVRDAHAITIVTEAQYRIHLPLVLRGA
jgi:hypothetical protein